MQPLSIEYLNSITVKAVTEENLQKEIDECLEDVNDILIENWHLADSLGMITIQNVIDIWSSDAFKKVTEMYKKNGISISYYPPHATFSFKIIK